jgi:predicted DNA-binding transcriptional regulator YafY
VTSGRVLRLRYEDREGRESARDVEPVGYIRSSTAWYLLGWCRTRQALRAFRFDRVRSVAALAEVAPRRVVEPAEIQVPHGDLRTLTLV